MEEPVVKDKRICACGCGTVIAAFDKWHNRPRFYVMGHSRRGKKFTNIEKINRLCHQCNSKTSLNKLGNPIWHHKGNELICRSCYDKEHYWADIEYQKARAISYREKNRDKLLTSDRDYKNKNREWINQKRREFYYKHKEQQNKERMLYNRRSGQIAKILRYQLVDILGGRCVNCGYDNDKRALCLDHIRGGGRADRIFHRSPHRFYKFYYSNLDIAKKTLQILCANCNQIKLSVNGESLRAKI